MEVLIEIEQYGSPYRIEQCGSTYSDRAVWKSLFG